MIFITAAATPFLFYSCGRSETTKEQMDAGADKVAANEVKEDVRFAVDDASAPVEPE